MFLHIYTCPSNFSIPCVSDFSAERLQVHRHPHKHTDAHTDTHIQTDIHTYKKLGNRKVEGSDYRLMWLRELKQLL